MAMGIKRILGKAFRLPCRSHGLFLLILAVSFVPESLLFVASYMLEMPLYREILLNVIIEETVIVRLARDLKSLAIFKTLSLAIALAASVIRWIMVVHWASAAHQDEKVAPGDLVAKVGGAWRRTLITSLFRTLILITYILVMTLACGLSIVVLFEHPMLMYSWLLVVLVLSLAAFIYLELVCHLAEAVSAMEDGRYGFGAYDRAMKVMRGRMMQGFSLALAMSGIYSVLFIPYGLTWKAVLLGQHRLLLGLVNVSMRVLLGIVTMAACTVFYEDIKNNGGEKYALAGLALHFD